MKNHAIFLTAVLLSLSSVSCTKEEPEIKTMPEQPDPSFKLDEDEMTRYYANMFAYNMMSTYYLWNEEISTALSSWKTDDDPVEKVREVRYKDSDGADIDRWTQAFDDYSSFINGVNGISTTYGADFTLFYVDSSRRNVCAVITYVYKDSPAEKAGLKRGDAIFSINGRAMTASDYAEVLNSEYYGKGQVALTIQDGSTIDMTAVTMYEDPVILFSTFDCSGRKVGYLVYTSFTKNSYLRLLEAFKFFKDEDIDELVLDLRYNGGGQTTIEAALASMLAPEENVSAGDVYEVDVYNNILSGMLGDEQTRFGTSFSVGGDGSAASFSTEGYNAGISKLYVLTGPGTASASESLITGLRPYLDVEIIGAQTYGKYCAGLIYPATSWYEGVKDQLPSEDYSYGVKYTQNWGIYVMISRFADKDGNTPCMPDGFIPDYPVDDRPDKGTQLGDPEEDLLKVALQHAGYEYPPASTASVSSGSAGSFRPFGPLPPELVRPGIGRFYGKFEIVGEVGKKVEAEPGFQRVD